MRRNPSLLRFLHSPWRLKEEYSHEQRGYHEPLELLSEQTRDLHRTLVSLQEELEAIDWYKQRAEACQDGSLQEILLHNMREEVEHACMLVEWLRRHHEDFNRQLKTYLFSAGPVTAVEEARVENAKPREPAAAEASQVALRRTIGSLRENSS